MSTKKGTTRKTTKKEAVTVSSEEEVQTSSPQETTQPTTTTQLVADWTKESATLVNVGDDTVDSSTTSTQERRSVLDFDRQEAAKLESSKASDLTNDQLLMILVTRGEAQKNPVISSGCERVLRQINRERLPFNPRRRPQPPGQFRQQRPPVGEQTTPHFAAPVLPNDEPQRGNRGGNYNSQGDEPQRGNRRGVQYRERVPNSEFHQRSRNYNRGGPN